MRFILVIASFFLFTSALKANEFLHDAQTRNLIDSVSHFITLAMNDSSPLDATLLTDDAPTGAKTYHLLSNLRTLPTPTFYYNPSSPDAPHDNALAPLDSICILVIDNWNWTEVQAATYAALKRLGYKTLFRKIFSTEEIGPETWGNGLMVAILWRKT